MGRQSVGSTGDKCTRANKEKEKVLSFAYLKEHLSYNPDSGTFIWLKSSSDKIKKGQIAGWNRTRYRVICIKKKFFMAHRVAWLYMVGSWPALEIDHINGNTLDNRWSNLREVTISEQNRNLGLKKTNTSGICGVYWFKSTKSWRAKIDFDKKQIHLGFYKNFFEACCARKSAERKYGFHVNHGRKR